MAPACRLVKVSLVSLPLVNVLSRVGLNSVAGSAWLPDGFEFSLSLLACQVRTVLPEKANTHVIRLPRGQDLVWSYQFQYWRKLVLRRSQSKSFDYVLIVVESK